jgi:hypothetical protein
MQIFRNWKKSFILAYDMDFSIKKDKRHNGAFYRKTGDVKGATQTKKLALKDISTFEDINYIHLEHDIIRQHLIAYQIIPFNI